MLGGYVRGINQLSGNKFQAQSFNPSVNAKINQIDVKLCKNGNPTGSLHLTLHTDYSGFPSTSIIATSLNNIDVSTLPYCVSNKNWKSFSFSSDYIFSSNSRYWIVANSSYATSTLNFVAWEFSNASNYNGIAAYADKYFNWSIYSNAQSTFQEWYDSSSVPENTPTPEPTPTPTYNIHGTVYVDLNRNGVKESAESGFNGAIIQLSNGTSVTTDEYGEYSIFGLIANTYTLSLTKPEGFDTTSASLVELPITHNTTQNFGLTKSQDALLNLDQYDLNQNGYYDTAFRRPAQSFVPTVTRPISRIDLKMCKNGNASGDAWITLETDLNGFPSGTTISTSNYINNADLPTCPSGEWRSFEFSSNYNFETGVTYWIVTRTYAGGDNNIAYAYDTNHTYQNGTLTYYTPWTIQNFDLAFLEYYRSTEPLATPTETPTPTSTPTHTPTPTPNDSPTPTPTYTPTPTPLPTYSISGAVYKDINENGFRDEDEAGYENAELQLSSGQTVTTDSNGHYAFSNVVTGSYTVNLSVPSGYFGTTPDSANIPLTADTTQNFGITMPHDQPVTTAVLAPNPDSQNEYPNPATITLEASADAGYNVINTYYAIDNGVQQLYTAPFAVSGAGSHTISYWSIDNASKEETPRPSSIFTISTTASNGQITQGQVSTDIGNGITITGNATSGGYVTVAPSNNNNGGPVPSQFKILNTFYEISSTAQFTFPITLTFQYPTNNGNQNLRVLHYTGSTWEQLETSLSYDSANQMMTLTAVTNSLSPFAIVELDETPPAITSFNLSNYVVQNGNSTTITADATDDITGISSLTYLLTSSTGQTTSGNLDFISPTGEWYEAVIAPTTGLYSVKLTARDFAGLESVSEIKYLAVYDPSAGFVTGGGWLTPDNSLRIGVSEGGKSNFGLVAKYINGYPNGNLTINYKNDGLEFKSTEIEWLTVSGSVADLQGQATLNNNGSYTYRAHIVDGSSDMIDIRIWDNNHSFANPTYRISNSLSGGSIKIHQ